MHYTRDGGGAFARARAVARLVILLAPAVVSGAGFGDRGTPAEPDGTITKLNLAPDEVWPLRIERGKFACDGDAVFITDGSTAYPLNGPAQALTRKHPHGRRPLEDIWLEDEHALAGLKSSGAKVKMIRQDISPVLQRGVKWCRSQR